MKMAKLKCTMIQALRILKSNKMTSSRGKMELVMTAISAKRKSLISRLLDQVSAHYGKTFTPNLARLNEGTAVENSPPLHPTIVPALLGSTERAFYQC